MRSFPVIFRLLFTALACFPALAQAEVIPGMYRIEGQHSTRGKYFGELELRPAADGSMDATHVITYPDFKHDGLAVQEVWTGKAVDASRGNVHLIFSLRQQDFIKRLGKEERTAASAINLELRILLDSLNQPRGSYGANFSGYRQHISYRGPVGPAPLYFTDRTIHATNSPVTGLKRKAVDRLFKKYQNDEYVKQFEGRDEYKKGVHYMVHDRTDFAFYSQNPGVVRVANKIVDGISLVESVVRRNAFALTLEEKGQGYERDMVRHINEAGMYSPAHFSPEGKFESMGTDGDSTLWTGVYVAAQAFHYQATRDPAALEKMKKSLRALMTLVEITGDPKQFARTLEIFDPNKALTPGWHRGTGRFEHLNWFEGGNNDMFKGIVYGMLSAWDALPANEAALREEMRALSYKINDLEIPNDKVWNKPLSQGMVALFTGDPIEREKYLRTYDDPRTALSELKVNDTFYFAGITDWSGLHLSTISFINAIILADKLGANDIAGTLRERYFEAWKTVRETDRHFMTITLKAFAAAAVPQDYQPDFTARLDNAIWGLREIPYPRPRYEVEWDHSIKPEWCISPFPRLPWKFLADDPPPPSFGYQGVMAYPVFESHAFSSNYIWKDTAFPFRQSAAATEEYGGVDYIHWYWLARKIGMIPQAELTVPSEKPPVVVPPPPAPPISPPLPPVPGPVVPPPPAPPAPLLYGFLGDGTAQRFVEKKFEWGLPSGQVPAGARIFKVRLVSNKEKTKMVAFSVVFADNAEERTLSGLMDDLHPGQVKEVDLEGRPLREVKLRTDQVSWRDKPGEFRVELGYRYP